MEQWHNLLPFYGTKLLVSKIDVVCKMSVFQVKVCWSQQYAAAVHTERKDSIAH